METISIMIPAWNSGNHLAAAIASAQRAFGGSGDSIIVVDDGSKDDTWQVAAKAGVRCVRHPSNRGIASGLNTALASSDSDYVAWLSSDDQYVDEAGRALRQAMEQAPGADLYFGCFRHIDPAGSMSEVLGRPGLGPSPTGVALGDIFVDLLFGCYINGSTTVMKRRRMIELGLFDTGYRYSQDYAMWLLMTFHESKVVFVNDVLGLRRVHDGQLSWKPTVRRAITQENRRLLAGYLADASFERITRRVQNLGLDRDHYFTMLAQRCLQLGLPQEALRLISSTSRPPAHVAQLARQALGYLYRRGSRLVRGETIRS